MSLADTPSNPYAAPLSSSAPSPQHNCRRAGDVLIVPAHGALPERCVKCNEPATMDKRKTFSWHHSGWYLLLLPGILIYIIAATLVTKRAKISIGLCQAHRARRRNFGLAAFALMLAGIGALLGAVAAEQGSYLGLISGVSLFAAVMLALFGTRVLYPDRIDRDQARLKGCGEVFLASLPSEPYF